MIPQIGIELFQELNINSGRLLDPYCGTGSSFVVGLRQGLEEMDGFDINPLAILISRVKFTKIELDEVKTIKKELRNNLYEFIKSEDNIQKIKKPDFFNIDYWFSEKVIIDLTVLKFFLSQIESQEIQQFLLIPFSEAVRECSYVRNNEFKLYKMKPKDVLLFNPDVFGVYFAKLNYTIKLYKYFYYPLL